MEVHARGEFAGQLWVAMDYVEGSTAARLMAERFPAVSPATEVLAIVSAVASALDHAHQRGLLHRDVPGWGFPPCGRHGCFLIQFRSLFWRAACANLAEPLRGWLRRA